jgi:membrane fusion protein (multidrug efflux system)
MSETKSSRRLVLLVVIPSVALVGGLLIYLLGGRYATTENAYTKADVISIRPQVAGVIIERLVAENDQVHAGQLLFVVDPQPYRVALAKAEAKLDEVRTTLAALQASYHEKQSELQLAQENQDYATKEQARQADLAARKLVAKAAYDEVSHNRRITEQQAITLERDLTRIAESLGGTADLPLEQHPSYRAAVAEVEQAKLNLGYTRVVAARAGIVTKPPEVGEFLPVGTAAMSLVASDNLWVEANFVETDLTHVRVGQLVDVTLDIYPDRVWQGEVQSISPATGAEFSVIPAQNATGNWVKIAQRVPVRIRLNPQGDAPVLQAGLSSHVAIDTHYKRSLFGISI